MLQVGRQFLQKLYSEVFQKLASNGVIRKEVPEAPENTHKDVQALLETATSLGMETDMDSEEYSNVEEGLPTESLDGWEEALEYREALHSSMQ